MRTISFEDGIQSAPERRRKKTHTKRKKRIFHSIQLGSCSVSLLPNNGCLHETASTHSSLVLNNVPSIRARIFTLAYSLGIHALTHSNALSFTETHANTRTNIHTPNRIILEALVYFVRITQRFTHTHNPKYMDSAIDATQSTCMSTFVQMNTVLWIVS